MEDAGPKLIDPSMKFYMSRVLKTCHENRTLIYYYVLNVSVFVLFVAITGLVLYYCYQQKKTPYELHQKMLRDQSYILSKIRYYKEEQQKLSSTKLTNLPIM